MTRRAAVLALLGAASLAGCGALEPFPTVTAGAAPDPPGSRQVAICYNSFTTSLAELRVQAQQECGAGATARPADTDWYMQYCPLLLPARAVFACTPTK